MPEHTKVAWDLADLFSGIDDPRIDKNLDEALERSKQFAATYRGKIDSDKLTAQTLLDAIATYEEIVRDLTKISSFATLTFSADTSKHEHGALLQHVQERQTEVALELMFFELELMAAKPEVIDPVAAHPLLANYRHFVHASRLFRDHRLSEPEERIMEEKANSGSRAFDRLFDESVSSIEFKVMIKGEEQTMTEPEVLALLRDPSREVRKAAAASLTDGLTRTGRLLTFIFNTLLFDKSVDDRLRKYEYPEQARNISNELEPETVETVMSTCVENYPLVARYYRVKRDILGLDELTHYDRYAPLFEAKKPYTFEQGRDTVLASFERFSPAMKAAAEEFFAKRWIDAAPRKGKRGGAFCLYCTPDLHPYVLVNYLNRQDDVMTLAHELGHGVHASLSRCQTLLNYSSVLPVAELASTFGEILVFESLVADADLDDKMALYAGKIEDIFATVFRQAAMYRFEQELHRARRELGELTAEEIGEMWQTNIQAMFGDSVNMGDEHKCWWMYVSHFIGSPFYVYAYSFGELLVMALYAMYKREGAAFVPKYIEMLKTGGACSPQELLERVGIDVRSKEFWQGGVDVLETFVSEFERLHGEWKRR